MRISEFYGERLFPEYREQIRGVLNSVLKDIEKEAHPDIFETIRYACEPGGKLLRALMVVSFTKAQGGPLSDALLCGVALELMHTASLILDDLPSMDNAQIRRGKPSCHQAFGEARAILAAVALINHAYTILGKLPKTDASGKIRLVRELAHAVGPSGLISGQWMDLHGELETFKDVERMHYKKTALLFECASIFSAILAEENEVACMCLRKFGARFGMAFQLLDDLLDLVASEEEIEKPAQQDIQKLGYLQHASPDEIDAQFHKYFDEAFRLATGSQWSEPAVQFLEPLIQIFEEMLKRFRTLKAT